MREMTEEDFQSRKFGFIGSTHLIVPVGGKLWEPHGVTCDISDLPDLHERIAVAAPSSSSHFSISSYDGAYSFEPLGDNRSVIVVNFYE